MGRRALLAIGILLTASLVIVLVLAGRGPLSEWRLLGVLAPPTPHEAYADALRTSGLAETALGRDWLAAAAAALARPLEMPAPFREAAWFPADEPRAVAYRVDLRRGQRFAVTATLEGDTDTLLFLDLFTATDPPESIASAPPATGALEIEVARDGSYLLRVQPELLRAARVMLHGAVTASLRFPVEGMNARALQSVFGAEREGGRRRHEGVDIFAPRDTPVLAAADGIVTSVTTNALGGNVVWLWDTGRGLTHYYAHLTRQDVVRGQRVLAGDRLGTVGNTGNARTTPPHLHFGLYDRGRGAIDPAAFVAAPPDAPQVSASGPRPGDLARVIGQRASLRSGPAQRDEGSRLARDTAVQVVGRTTHGAARVRLPDRREGYLAASALASASKSVGRVRVRASAPLLHLPVPGAPEVARLEAGSTYEVLGRFNDFALAAVGDDLRGWVADRP